MIDRAELDSKTAALLVAQKARDLETGGHTTRVKLLSLRLAAELRLGAEDSFALHYGALLHDVGKIGTPDAVLRKPGKHTDAETAVMRHHVTIGAAMLRSLHFPESVVLIVEQHHERWDGMGYPQGLSRYRICAGARVFAVADTLDAILSDRCYRRGNTYEAARQEIERWGGKQFDPEAVAAFLRVEREEWLRIARCDS